MRLGAARRGSAAPLSRFMRHDERPSAASDPVLKEFRDWNLWRGEFQSRGRDGAGDSGSWFCSGSRNGGNDSKDTVLAAVEFLRLFPNADESNLNIIDLPYAGTRPVI